MSHNCGCGQQTADHQPRIASPVEPAPTTHHVDPTAATPAPLSVLADLLAGSLAGAAQVIVGQPLDTARIRIQTTAVGTFNGTWDVLAKTVRYEGLPGLFKGMASPL